MNAEWLNGLGGEGFEQAILPKSFLYSNFLRCTKTQHLRLAYASQNAGVRRKWTLPLVHVLVVADGASQRQTHKPATIKNISVKVTLS